MSDNDNVIQMPGTERVDPPCEVEVEWDQKMLQAVETVDQERDKAHQKAINHASDVNPNEAASLPFPRVDFRWTATSCYFRVHVDRDDFADIPISRKELMLMFFDIAAYLKNRFFQT